ncbi:hypothetical protein OS189_13380 [Sulfitobacter sp. F26169L]|uniref:hypothetical protein n=1 Tax=Sulfitobacter sp. F26169L TaxID=2996015 RepID=UPI0022610071|nr:hypothetical protein [Sulfitobacter sp. F26169L]MCX7567338.1 hypothetical protein [Sulfitobacter sp. F26169L]
MRFLPVVAVFLTLSACGDPLAGLDRLADVDIAEDKTVAAALPDAEEIAREGFLGTSAAEGAAPAATPDAEGDVEVAAASGGFLRGLIKRVAKTDPAEAIAADVAESQSGAVVIETTPVESASAIELVALPAEEVTPQAEPRKRRGLFGGGSSNKASKARTGPDARDVPYGTVLAFGEIARVCEARGKPMGKKIDGLGRRGFTLHDSNPGIRDKRTFYVTGFQDNCPRQFTAANALFGAPSFYEQIRYSPAGQHLPYAATDKAYDKVKSSVCRAGKNKPCGKDIRKLDAGAAFVTAYQFHEHNGQWKEFLIYDGEVLAAAVKSAN